MRARKGRELSGILDWLKGLSRKKPVEERGLTLPEASFFEAFRPGLPAVRPEEQRLPAAPAPEPRPAGGLMRIFEAFRPPAVQEEPAARLPAVPQAPASAAPALWEALFGPPAEAAQAPPPMFPVPSATPPLPVEVPREPFPGFPSPAQAALVPAAPPRPPQYTFIRIPRLPAVAGWRPPSPEELAEHFRGHFLLDEVFRAVDRLRSEPEWAPAVAERAALGQPVVAPIDPIVHRNLFTDLAKVFNIPWGVVESYIGPAQNEAQLQEATRRFLDEVVRPLSNRSVEAFELLKPQHLPGWFLIQHDPQSDNWWLYYVEAMLSPYVPTTAYGGRGGTGA